MKSQLLVIILMVLMKKKKEEPYIPPISYEEVVNLIKVKFDPGFGKCLVLACEDMTLGKWDLGYRMENSDRNEWEFRSKKLRNGTQFKIIIYDWFDDDTIDIERIKAINPRLLKWENHQGEIGNKIMNFVNNEMTHYPQF